MRRVECNRGLLTLLWSQSINGFKEITVWNLDRLGRSLRDLITMLDDLKHRSVNFRSLTGAIDTQTPTDRAMWQMIVRPGGNGAQRYQRTNPRRSEGRSDAGAT